MPQAVPAIVIAAGQAVAAGAITAGIFYGFVVNVALAGLRVVDRDGDTWVALKKQQSQR